MDNDRLIQAITEEVMKRLMDMLKKEKVFPLIRKKVLVLNNSDNQNSKIQSQIVNENYDISYIEDMSNVEDYECIVIESINNLELANLSLGLPGGEKEKIIIDAILKGKNICLLSEGIEFKKFKNKCNNNFYNMYKAYEDKLREFGIKIIKQNEIKEFMDNLSECKEINGKKEQTSASCSNIKKEYSDLTSRRLVSEIDLRRVMVNGNKNVSISQKTIVTPLAKDFIRMNGLNLVRE